MAIISIKLQVQIAWWLRFYMFGVQTMCFFTGLSPDLEKVQQVFRRAVKVTVVK